MMETILSLMAQKPSLVQEEQVIYILLCAGQAKMKFLALVLRKALLTFASVKTKIRYIKEIYLTSLDGMECSTYCFSYLR